MNTKICYAIGIGILAATVCGQAQFIDDEFNSGLLGAQWTFIESDPVGSTVTLTGTHLRMDAQEGSDHWFFNNPHETAIEQNAPVGTNWEVVTKIDNYDPVAVGFQRRFLKTG